MKKDLKFFSELSKYITELKFIASAKIATRSGEYNPINWTKPVIRNKQNRPIIGEAVSLVVGLADFRKKQEMTNPGSNVDKTNAKTTNHTCIPKEVGKST